EKRRRYFLLLPNCCWVPRCDDERRGFHRSVERPCDWRRYQYLVVELDSQMTRCKGPERNLDKREIAAMWIWSKKYAQLRSVVGAIEFYHGLSDYDKRLIEQFIKEL